jgi:hypothetical protein
MSEEEEVPEEELEEYVEEMEKAEKKPDSAIGDIIKENKPLEILTSCEGLEPTEIENIKDLDIAKKILTHYSEHCLTTSGGKRKVRAPSEWNLFYKRYCAPAVKKMIESNPGSEYIKTTLVIKEIPELSKPAKGRIMMRTCSPIYKIFQGKTEDEKKGIIEVLTKNTGEKLFDLYSTYFREAVEKELKKKEKEEKKEEQITETTQQPGIQYTKVKSKKSTESKKPPGGK